MLVYFPLIKFNQVTAAWSCEKHYLQQWLRWMLWTATIPSIALFATARVRGIFAPVTVSSTVPVDRQQPLRNSHSGSASDGQNEPSHTLVESHGVPGKIDMNQGATTLLKVNAFTARFSGNKESDASSVECVTDVFTSAAQLGDTHAQALSGYYCVWRAVIVALHKAQQGFEGHR